MSLTFLLGYPSFRSVKSNVQSRLLRSCGILRWSTLGLLAGSGVSVVSCDSESTYVATADDEKMAALEQKLDELDTRRAQFTQGYVLHNMELPGLGFYHADAQDFFPIRYGQEQDGKWFANGEWLDTQPPASDKSMSHPKPEALKKVEEVLAREQEALAQAPGETSTAPATVHHHHGGGMGIGNMMLMYWLLSGNRGSYMPGAAFHRAEASQQSWQRTMQADRQKVSSYAAANPGYQRLVQQSRTSGSVVRAGSSVRGGFGGGSSGSSFRSFGG